MYNEPDWSSFTLPELWQKPLNLETTPTPPHLAPLRFLTERLRKAQSILICPMKS